jgi:hypothetical protein
MKILRSYTTLLIITTIGVSSGNILKKKKVLVISRITIIHIVIRE